MTPCRSIAPLLETFRDGELSPERVLEVEQHLTECSHCVERVRFSEALRLSIRRHSRSSAPVSTAFQSRVAGALEAARQREWEQEELLVRSRPRLLDARKLGALAMAATVLIWANREQDRPGQVQYASSIDSGVDSLLEELVDHHVQGRADFTELAHLPALLPEAELEIGVPLHVPSFKQYGGRLEGASLVPVSNQRAASLRYSVGNHRMTLYVYNSSRFPLQKHLQQRLVGKEPVYVGVRRGYSIGATEHRGIGYALASDLSEPETAELVAGLN
jgi:anti-sigma factor RsiW